MMKTIQLEVKDDYLDNILNFLKLLPENVAQVTQLHDSDETKFESELLSRIDDIKSNRVQTISRDELFDGI